MTTAVEAVKPLDLSNLIRDAFLTGRGLKDGDKLSPEDLAAWTDYDPTDHNCYKRIVSALDRTRNAPDGGEVWRPIPGWEDAYEVSNMGRVRSVGRHVPDGSGGTYLVNGAMLTPRPQMHGYLVVTLRKGRNVHVTARVHRLVAAAFIPNPENKPNINHIDCDRANNRASNLEWCSQRENLAHMDSLGRRAKPWLGKRSPFAVLSDDQVRALRSRWADGSVSLSHLAREFNISKRAAMRCAKRETYSDVL